MNKELLRYKEMDAEKLAAELDYFFRQNYKQYSSLFHSPTEKEKDLYDKLMQGRFVGIKKLLEDMGQDENSYLMKHLTQHENNYPMDLYFIYQVKRECARDYLFERYDFLQKRGLSVDSDNYEIAYSAELTPADSLENIFAEFNLNHPADFRGHSLSVSDVVIFRENGKETAYYCDGVGFKEVPEFFKESPNIIEQKDEKELRSDINSPTGDELDMCFEIAYNIDEHLSLYSGEYRTYFPDLDGEPPREIIADAMLEAKTAVIKKMLNNTPHENSLVLLQQLSEYEKAYPKNHYEIYRLKPEYEGKCSCKVDKQRNDREYISCDMYNLIASVPLHKEMTPKGIELSEIVKDCFTNDRYIPNTRDIIVINFNGIEKAYFREMKDYVEVPEFVSVHTRSAARSNYRGYTAFIGADEKVYLGRTENYLYNEKNGFLPFYNNSDNSLVYITENQKMFPFLYGSGWVVSQQAMIDCGAFTEKDYAEYAALNEGILSDLDKIREIRFDGECFSYPVFDRAKGAINYLETAEKTVEQNYNQIDGQINNKPLEERTQNKPSIKQQLQAGKKEHGEQGEHKPPRFSPPEL